MAYLKGYEQDMMFYNEEISTDDFELTLSMPDTFAKPSGFIINHCILNLIKYYILCEWYKDKNVSLYQASNLNIEKLESELRRNLESRTTPVQTVGKLF